MIDVGFISIVYMGFVQGPQKLNDGSRKVIYLGTIDQGFTAQLSKSDYDSSKRNVSYED
jgi:hypothetical protein